MRESKRRKNRWIAALLMAVATGSASVAQEVRDLTASDPTEQQLIEILKPKADDLDNARGIGVARPRTKCTLKGPGGSRGIGLKPLSDVAAIRVRFAYNSAEIL